MDTIIIESVKELRYYLQHQSPDGSWYDSLGTTNLEIAVNHLRHSTKLGKPGRLVQKTIHILEVV